MRLGDKTSFLNSALNPIIISLNKVLHLTNKGLRRLCKRGKRTARISTLI